MLKNGIWIFVLAFMLVLVFVPSYSRLQDKVQQNKDLNAKIRELQAKQKDLSKEKDLLENDPAYLEKVAREKMGIVKDGEVVYRIESANNKE